jgi:hypothetical protein
MFTITFEDEVYKQWSCEFIFNEFEEAKKYLIEQGFSEKNRLFVRENYNWSKYIKAYISPRKIYKA